MCAHAVRGCLNMAVTLELNGLCSRRPFSFLKHVRAGSVLEFRGVGYFYHVLIVFLPPPPWFSSIQYLNIISCFYEGEGCSAQNGVAVLVLSGTRPDIRCAIERSLLVALGVVGGWFQVCSVPSKVSTGCLP